METYISLLRGINVSGQKKILMADLKLLYAAVGFGHIATYIQSGNVVFQTNLPESNQELARQIEKAIQIQYGFTVPVVVRKSVEIAQVIRSNPFLSATTIDPANVHVTFLAALPLPEKVEKLATYHFPPDQFVVNGQEVFLHIPERYGDTKLSNNLFEKTLQVTATTRNWKTVNQLHQMATLPT